MELIKKPNDEEFHPNEPVMVAEYGKLVLVRALIYHLAGHELHQIKIIKERYLT